MIVGLWLTMKDSEFALERVVIAGALCFNFCSFVYSCAFLCVSQRESENRIDNIFHYILIHNFLFVTFFSKLTYCLKLIVV